MLKLLQAKLAFGLAIILALTIILGFFIILNIRKVDNQKYFFSLYLCAQDSDCMLVQDRWCETVISINKEFENKWQKKNITDTNRARKNRQTCEPTLVKYTDIKNFNSECVDSKCVARFHADILYGS